MNDKTPPPAQPEKSSLERMADLTRRIIAVKKTELPKAKPTKRKHR
jgi:hypothetical protein